MMPVLRVDFLGFDPLGFTTNDFKYHKKIEFENLDSWKILERCRALCRKDEGININAEKAIIQIIENRLKDIIKYLWNPLSRTATENIAKVIKNYNKYVYSKLEKQGLTQVRSILDTILKKLNTYFQILRVPNGPSEYTDRVMWRLLKVLY